MVPKKLQDKYRTSETQTGISKLEDKLNFSEFRIRSNDNLEMVAAMLGTSIRDSFLLELSREENKEIQRRNIRWNCELNKLKMNTGRKLKVTLVKMCGWMRIKPKRRRYAVLWLL